VRLNRLGMMVDAVDLSRNFYDLMALARDENCLAEAARTIRMAPDESLKAVRIRRRL